MMDHEESDDSPFTPLERAIFDIEREYPKYDGVKDDVIRRRLDMSPFNYFQILNRLMNTPEAMEHEPQIIGRLQRVRQQKRDQNTHTVRH